MQPSFSRTLYLLGFVWFFTADKGHAILPQTTVFVGIFLWICSDNNECMDDNNECMDDNESFDIPGPEKATLHWSGKFWTIS